MPLVATLLAFAVWSAWQHTTPSEQAARDANRVASRDGDFTVKLPVHWVSLISEGVTADGLPAGAGADLEAIAALEGDGLLAHRCAERCSSDEWLLIVEEPRTFVGRVDTDSLVPQLSEAHAVPEDAIQMLEFNASRPVVVAEIDGGASNSEGKPQKLLLAWVLHDDVQFALSASAPDITPHLIGGIAMSIVRAP